jgi:hypothetical protein
MDTKHIIKSFSDSFLATLLLVSLLAMSYFVFEPSVGRAQDTSGPFTISQTITGETSFLVDAVNTTLSGSLNGITGGTANGSTTVVVQTNSPTGYTMQIAFFDNGTLQTMQGRVTDSDSIRDYPATAGQPSYNFSTASTSAVFAYTVSAAESSDLDQSFLDNGSACNTGSGYTADRCWMEPATTTFQVIDRDTDATTGATTTLHFRVHVPNNPTPGLVVDTYTATATLTVAPQ